MSGLDVVVLCASLSTTDAAEIEARLRLEAELSKPGSERLEVGCTPGDAFASRGEEKLSASSVPPEELKATLLRLGLELLEGGGGPVGGAAPDATSVADPVVLEERPPAAATLAPPDEAEPTTVRARPSTPWFVAARATYEYFGVPTSGSLGFELAGSFAPLNQLELGLFTQGAWLAGVPDGFSVVPIALGLVVELHPIPELSCSLGPLLSLSYFGAPAEFATLNSVSEQPGAQLEVTWLSAGASSGFTFGVRGRVYTAERSVVVEGAELFSLSAWTLGASIGYRFAGGTR